MMRAARVLGLVVGLSIASACAKQAEISKLSVTDVLSGWYDNGIKDGKNQLVPSISFRLKNGDEAPATYVDLTVSFWQKGADGESDSSEVQGIGSAPVAPGSASPPILVRSNFGYTIEQPRAELFTHSQFKDFTVKIFAKRADKIVPLGEFPIERRILEHVTQTAGKP
jgi:hypothetical protein